MIVRKISVLLLSVLLCLLCLVACNSDSPSESVASSNAGEKVFSVGSEYFGTLEAAVEHLKTKDASSDYTIVMHKNASGTGATISDLYQEVAIDFAGYSYTLTGSKSITVSGCSVELKKMNMTSGTVNVENNATVSMKDSNYSGDISVKNSSFSIDAASEVSIETLTVKDAQLGFGSDVYISNISNQGNSTVNGNNIEELLSDNPLEIEHWITEELQSPVLSVGDTDYGYTYMAEFSFLEDEKCKLVVKYIENNEWTLFGTINGSYDQTNKRVTWDDEARSYYDRAEYRFVIVIGSGSILYNLVLTDPDGGTMTLKVGSYE